MTHSAKILWFCGAAASAALAACGSSSRPGGGGADAGCAGLVGCECKDGRCSAGQCVAGVCTDCEPGEAACTCGPNRACNAGLRCGSAGTCEVCPAGAEGCACGAGGSCNAGLRCGSAGACEACPAGAEGCACGTGDACGPGLRCEASICAADACVAGAEGCPCRTADPKCDGATYCDSSNRCRACAPDVAGCPCGAADACGGGLVCDEDALKCRAPKTCAGLRASGACVAHQVCAEAPGLDAACAVATCEAEFKWDGRTQTCVACLSASCAAEPTCADLSADCASLHRVCEQPGQVASCGACKAFYTEPASGAGKGACVLAPQCGAATCTDTQYCDSSGAPTCKALPCPHGQALEYPSYGACVPCPRSCSGAGTTGRIWPFQTHQSDCTCETLPGYFMPAGASGQPTRCDADEDGWVRRDAMDEVIKGDPALLANSRCPIRRVDQVRLVDEYGIGMEIRSCTEGLVLASSSAPCTEAMPLPLLETARNDVGGEGGKEQPPYGAQGRALVPSELNALTKACVSLDADYNDNGVKDIAEVQAQKFSPDGEQARLASFAYFMELADSYYEAGKGNGTLVIRERSRCSPDFPLRYDLGITDPLSTADKYHPTQAKTYWRNCARRRDSSYSQLPAAPGFDFAQWDCPATSGTCPATPFARAGPVNTSSPDRKPTWDIGLCELRGATPADGRWRGFNHHSQFKCVHLAPARVAPYDRLATDFATASPGTNDELVFNQCFAQPCAGSPCRAIPSPASGLQTATPSVHCLARPAPLPEAVGFAAVGFHGYAKAGGAYPAGAATYRNGCVAEDEESRSSLKLSPDAAIGSYLCPYPVYCNTLDINAKCDVASAKAHADESFGRLSCYGTAPFYLWSDGGTAFATLRWAASADDTANGLLR